MGRQMPWDEIPDTNFVPGGMFHLEGKLLEETQSGTGKLMYKAQMEVVAPKDHEGHNFFENFVIGSDEDPNAEFLDTWKKSFGARRLKQMLKGAQIPQNNDMDAVCLAFAGTQFLSNVTYSIETEGEYKGTPRNRLTVFYKVGERPVGIDQKELAKVRGASAAPAAARPVAAAPPVQGVAPVAPITPVAPAPPTVAAPAPPAPPAPPTQAPMQGMKCQICQRDVPMNEFADHVNAHISGKIDQAGNVVG